MKQTNLWMRLRVTGEILSPWRGPGTLKARWGVLGKILGVYVLLMLTITILLGLLALIVGGKMKFWHLGQSMWAGVLGGLVGSMMAQDFPLQFAGSLAPTSFQITEQLLDKDNELTSQYALMSALPKLRGRWLRQGLVQILEYDSEILEAGLEPETWAWHTLNGDDWSQLLAQVPQHHRNELWRFARERKNP